MLLLFFLVFLMLCCINYIALKHFFKKSSSYIVKKIAKRVNKEPLKKEKYSLLDYPAPFFRPYDLMRAARRDVHLGMDNTIKLHNSQRNTNMGVKRGVIQEEGQASRTRFPGPPAHF